MKLSDLDFYSSPWLSVSDLGGRPARVTISEWKIEEVRQRDASKVRKVALSFAGKRKRLILNMTQGKAAEAAWGEALEGWIGKQCILQPGRAENGKDTILLVPLVAQSAPDAPKEHQAPDQPPAPATQQSAAGTGQQPPAEALPAGAAPMTDAEAAALWRKEGEPYPGFSG